MFSTTCKRTTPDHEGPKGYLRPLPIPDGNWRDISIDYVQDLPACSFLGHIYRHIVVIVCRLTKRRRYYPTETLGAEELAQIFLHHWKIHGLPDTIVSDRGSAFISQFWGQLMKRLRIARKLSTAYHPQTDGQTERSNQDLEAYLRRYVNYAQDNWVEWLPIAEFQVNDTVNASTGLTPFFADLGFHPRSGIHPSEAPAEGLSPKNRADIRKADDILNAHRDLVTFLKVQLRWAQQAQADQANKSRIDTPNYKIGDLVYVSTRNWSTDRPSKKLEDKWAGPWKITRVIRAGHSFEIDLPQSLRSRCIFPVFSPDMLRSVNEHPLSYQQPLEPKPINVTKENGSVEQEWLVDEVVSVKKSQGRWFYLVKWADDGTRTWEPADNYWLQHYDTLLFHWKNPTAKQPPGFQFPLNWEPKAEDQQ